MDGRGSTRRAARLLCAAAICALAHVPSLAQTAPPPPPAQPPDAAELDPNAPLAPLPDLGVAWPDLSTPEPTPAPATEQPGQVPTAGATLDEGTSEIRYSVIVEGLSAVGRFED